MSRELRKPEERKATVNFTPDQETKRMKFGPAQGRPVSVPSTIPAVVATSLPAAPAAAASRSTAAAASHLLPAAVSTPQVSTPQVGNRIAKEKGKVTESLAMTPEMSPVQRLPAQSGSSQQVGVSDFPADFIFVGSSMQRFHSRLSMPGLRSWKRRSAS